MNKIYLDNSATTRISDVALKKYIEISTESFGNPSSLHTLGHEAEKILRTVRESVQKSFGVRDGEVIFTASGTEANNLAITGRAYAKDRYRRGAKIITTDSEHASVSEPLSRLEREGYRIARIPTVGGKVDLECLKAELTGDVILVTVMMVNNETGALYDIAEISRIVKAMAPEALVHVDATQSYMKLPMSRRKLGCDMITVSSHKIHGPKGVGALYIAPDVIKTRGISPIILGGGQEGGLRSGTENVPGIAAFGAAIDEGAKDLASNAEKMNALREYIIEEIRTNESTKEISLTLPDSHAPHILNVTLPRIKSETMLHYLSSVGIFVSSGSACSSNSAHKSSALISFGRSEADADSSIRISLSHDSTKEDADALIRALGDGIKRLARIR